MRPHQGTKAHDDINGDEDADDDSSGGDTLSDSSYNESLKSDWLEVVTSSERRGLFIYDSIPSSIPRKREKEK